MEIVIYITISILILAIALIKQRMLANIETSNPYHAQYILRRRDDYLVLFDRDALSSRFFYDAFPGMRLRHQVTGDTDDDRLAHSPADRMYMLGGMSDTASNRITFERDSQYRITSVSHTDGIRLKLTYHASGYLKAIHRTDNGIPLRPPRQPAGVHGRLRRCLDNGIRPVRFAGGANGR